MDTSVSPRHSYSRFQGAKKENLSAKTKLQIPFGKPSLPPHASQMHTLLLHAVCAVGVCTHTYIHKYIKILGLEEWVL